MRIQSTPRYGHAVVVGASLAGLLAARVLAKRFERVTLIERDALPDGPEPRKGVPQARHVHALLIRGERIIGGLFPDLVPALLERGAMPVRFGRDLRWHHFGTWKVRFESALRGIAVSRPCLEFEIRRRLVEIANVRVIDSSIVTRFMADWDRSRITGVYWRGRSSIVPDEPLHADLVVDASGRGSQTPQRLRELGYERPEESHVRVNFGYASRIFETPAGSRDWKGPVRGGPSTCTARRPGVPDGGQPLDGDAVRLARRASPDR